MSIKLRKEYKYCLALPTSMGIRLTPDRSQPIHAGRNFNLQVTSAESNVGSLSSFLGLPVLLLTAFVKDSPIARIIKNDLSRRNISYLGKEVEQSGPWGYRHQINFADTGYGLRGPRVYNDRAGEVGRTMSAKDFDLEQIFGSEGVQIVHMSGLLAALSESTGNLCSEIAKTARKHSTLVSFDLNYRESFWKDRRDELSAVFSRIAGLADIIIGNEEDFQLCLGIKGPSTGGKDISEKLHSYKDMISLARKHYPGASIFATTLREVIDSNNHLWGALLSVDDNWHEIEPRPIHVLDRIGGGDGFAGGLLYAILKGWEPEKWLQFGWANGALTATLLTDCSEPADEEQVWSIWYGNARVKR